MIQEVEIKSFIFNDKDELKAAVNEWCDDEAAAQKNTEILTIGMSAI